MSVYSIGEKQWLYRQIGRPSERDAHYLFRTLVRHGENYTENSNGIFFDLDSLSDDTIRDLMTYYKTIRPSLDRPYYEEE